MKIRTKDDAGFTKELIECSHCHNKSQMQILGYGEAEELYGKPYDHVTEIKHEWYIYFCSNCNQVSVHHNIHNSDWIDFVEYEDGEYEIFNDGNIKEVLHPTSRDFSGTPSKILGQYHAAKRLVAIEPESAIVKIRRALEAICQDQKAQGNALHQKIEYLAKHNVIPTAIAAAALKLKDMGNLTAHQDDALKSRVTEADALAVIRLCEVLLEYIYEAPYMIEDLDQRLKRLKP